MIMKIYKLTWYLAVEERVIEVLITNEETAESRYRELVQSLNKGCWIGLQEMVENDEHVLVNGEVLHYKDI
ncbi:hypothetical protein [uncultured Duncaniella sp.]|uniref:hypothetical protein n=2 Tax=uncultured Duncaniella sp. TaxID=2768039 RepID=UPI0025B0FF97|nr:hypothetical protein [uncultured Duncaniella sp.]